MSTGCSGNNFKSSGLIHVAVTVDFLNFVTKCSDIKATQKILISIPSLNEELRTLCFNHGITVLLAKDKEEAVFELIKMISNVFMVNLHES